MRTAMPWVLLFGGVFCASLGLQTPAGAVPGKEYCTPIPCSYGGSPGTCCFMSGNVGLCMQTGNGTCVGATIECKGLQYYSDKSPCDTYSSTCDKKLASCNKTQF